MEAEHRMECEEVLEGSSSTIFRDGRNATVIKPFSGVAKRMRLACRTSFVPQCQPLRAGLPCPPASLLCSSDWRVFTYLSSSSSGYQRQGGRDKSVLITAIFPAPRTVSGTK